MKLIILSMITTLVFANNLQNKLDERRERSSIPSDVREIMVQANEYLRKSGIEKKAIKKDMKIPQFSLGGRSVSDYHKKNNIILKFYRGSWCPYCMIELKEYEAMYDKIKASNCEIVGITPDKKKEISKTKKKFNLSFPIYQDKDNGIAKKFGLAFKLNGDIQAIYKKFGIDLEKSHGNDKFELPMPGTYVVNKDGKVIYSYFDVDYTKRAEPREVLKACAN